jgi:hypothetical protein
LETVLFSRLCTDAGGRAFSLSEEMFRIGDFWVLDRIVECVVGMWEEDAETRNEWKTKTGGRKKRWAGGSMRELLVGGRESVLFASNVNKAKPIEA